LLLIGKPLVSGLETAGVHYAVGEHQGVNQASVKP
jgi:hypothetical protein